VGRVHGFHEIEKISPSVNLFQWKMGFRKLFRRNAKPLRLKAAVATTPPGTVNQSPVAPNTNRVPSVIFRSAFHPASAYDILSFQTSGPSEVSKQGREIMAYSVTPFEHVLTRPQSHLDGHGPAHRVVLYR
jgi:hypothetical protein